MDAHQKINNLIKNPIRYSSTQEYPGGIFFIINSSRTSVRLGAWFWSEKLTYSYQNHCASSRSVYLSRRPNSHWDKFAITHHLKDATEKVLILRKVAQDKVYLYVLRYYILYAKTVFQWRPWRGGSLLDWDKYLLLPFTSDKTIKSQCNCYRTHHFQNRQWYI